MNNLEQQIQEHFNQEKVKNSLNELIQKYFVDQKQRQAFLKVFELIKKGEFDNVDLPEYLSDWYGFDIDKGLALDKELFDKVYKDIYDEIQELYEQKNKEKTSLGEDTSFSVPTDVGTMAIGSEALARRADRSGERVVGDENKPSQQPPQSQRKLYHPDASKVLGKKKDVDVEDAQKNEALVETKASIQVKEPLVQSYNKFIASSLFQNILASQELMRERYTQGRQTKQDGSKLNLEPAADNLEPAVNNLEPASELDWSGLKNEFYSAVNSGDKVRVVGILRLIASRGELRRSFKDDKRYIEFFGGVVKRHKGAKEKDDFEKDPANQKYLVEFLRFVLEKRLGFSLDESAMIGESLGSLARVAGEDEYSDVAYGDEERNKFVWN